MEKQHFITFIYDFSHYGFTYLLNEKSQSLKVYANEVERQLDRKVKIIRLDRDGSYCGI